MNTVSVSSLFADSESFMGFIQDISEEDEVAISGGRRGRGRTKTRTRGRTKTRTRGRTRTRTRTGK